MGDKNSNNMWGGGGVGVVVVENIVMYHGFISTCLSNNCCLFLYGYYLVFVVCLFVNVLQI